VENLLRIEEGQEGQGLGDLRRPVFEQGLQV
jgi:hypothetical protein